MNRHLRILPLVVLLGCLDGCAAVRNGIHNMCADSADILRADLSFSFGTDMGAHVMLSKFAQLKSYSYEDLYRLGFAPRHLGLWEEERQDWWLGPKHSNPMRARMEGVAMYQGDVLKKLGRRAWAPLGMVAESADEIGVGFHLFLVGTRFGFRPMELVDFFANFIGLDPLGDNTTSAERAAMRQMRRQAKKAKEQAEKEKATPEAAPEKSQVAP